MEDKVKILAEAMLALYNNTKQLRMSADEHKHLENVYFKGIDSLRILSEEIKKLKEVDSDKKDSTVANAELTKIE